MIDIIALSVTHALLAIAAIRLVTRDELDREGEAKPRFGMRRRISVADEEGDRP